MLDTKLWSTLAILWISENYKAYSSNIGYIIVPIWGSFVFKLFSSKEIYKKELEVYELFSKKWLSIPKFWWLDIIESFYVLKLENIRKDFERKDDIRNLDLSQVANILSTIHSIDPSHLLGLGDNHWEYLILGDIHSSNFYERFSEDKSIVTLGVMDFSSARVWEREEDIANLYIDIWLDESILNKFLLAYKQSIDMWKLYKYAFLELAERIKHGMNLETEKRKKYYKFLLILKNKLPHGH